MDRKIGQSGETIDDCHSAGLNDFRGPYVYCPMAKSNCKMNMCVFYSADVEGYPAEYDEAGHIILGDKEFGSKEYADLYEESVTHHCLALEILEGVHWMVGRWNDDGYDQKDAGLKTLISEMAGETWCVKTSETNTVRYCIDT